MYSIAAKRFSSSRLSVMTKRIQLQLQLQLQLSATELNKYEVEWRCIAEY